MSPVASAPPSTTRISASGQACPIRCRQAAMVPASLRVGTMTERATDTAQTNTSRARTRHLALAAAIALAVLGIFWRAHGFQFLNFDDDVYVTQNPFVRDGLSRANVVDHKTPNPDDHKN